MVNTKGDLNPIQTITPGKLGDFDPGEQHETTRDGASVINSGGIDYSLNVPHNVQDESGRPVWKGRQ